MFFSINKAKVKQPLLIVAKHSDHHHYRLWQGPLTVPCNQLLRVPIFKWSTRLTIIRYENIYPDWPFFHLVWFKNKKGEGVVKVLNLILIGTVIIILLRFFITTWNMEASKYNNSRIIWKQFSLYKLSAYIYFQEKHYIFCYCNYANPMLH